jgi:hypothetical protein
VFKITKRTFVVCYKTLIQLIIIYLMEKEYFYLIGQSKIGPLSLNALKSAPISPATLVWNNSLPDWVEARTLQELAEVFVSTPPPPAPPLLASPPLASPPNYSTGNTSNSSTGGSFNNPERPPMPENYLIWAILATIFCCWPIGIFSIISAAKVSSAYNAGDFEGALKASASAKKMAIVTACAGGISYIIAIIFYAIMGVAYLGALGV